MGAGLGLQLTVSHSVASHQAIEVVAIGSVSAKSLLIKQTLDAAAQANLVRVILIAHRPTHLSVPAAAEDHDSRRSQPGSNHAQGPQPTRLLFLVTHPRQPVIPSKSQAYPQSHGRATVFRELMDAPRPRPTGRARRPSSNPEEHESESFPQLTKEHGDAPYLRAPTILRFPPNRCTLRVMLRPKASDSADVICGSTNSDTVERFPPKIDLRTDRQIDQQRLMVSKQIFQPLP